MKLYNYYLHCMFLEITINKYSTHQLDCGHNINEAFSGCVLKFSPKLESYTAVLSTSSSLTAFVESFCGLLRA